MTYQLKAHIKKLFHKEKTELLSKLKDYPNLDNVTIISFQRKLGRHYCMVNYNFKLKKFSSIQVIEEVIEL